MIFPETPCGYRHLSTYFFQQEQGLWSLRELKSSTYREWHTICLMILTFTCQALASLSWEGFHFHFIAHVSHMVFSSLSSFCLVATKSTNMVFFIQLIDGYILKPSPTTIINFSYKELALTFSELHPWASDCTLLATHIMVMSLTEPEHSAAIALSLIDVLNFSWIKPEPIPAICCRLRAKHF